MPSSICRSSLSRFACGALLAVLVGCATRPTAKPPVTPPPAGALVAHGAVSSVEVRTERIRDLVKSGVRPLQRRAVAGYLDALEGRVRAAIAGNTAAIARVDGELVVVLAGARALRTGRARTHTGWREVSGDVGGGVTGANRRSLWKPTATRTVWEIPRTTRSFRSGERSSFLRRLLRTESKRNASSRWDPGITIPSQTMQPPTAAGRTGASSSV